MQPTPAQWDSRTTPKALHTFAALAFQVEDALLSTFPHSVFLSLKCADEHSDTSMATQMHSMVIHSIDSEYIEGLSVTHGTPRNHIWIFV